ncbi:MAG TPA: hypothetical protein VEI97_00535, partial [bacterium]|nr:hypothetical protein [bacterium]
MKRRFPWRPVWVLLAVAAVAYGVAATPGFRRAAALRRWQPDCPQWEVTWHSGTRTALGLGHEHVDWVALDNELLVAKGPAIRVGGRRQALQLLRIHADGTVTEGPTLGALDLQDQWRQGGETYLLSKMKRFPGFKLTRVDPARLAAAEHISIPHGERPAGIHSKLPTGRFLGTLPDGTLAFITQVECEYISAASVAPGIRNPF